MNKLFKINNGNCTVTLFKDGTRIVETVDPNATSIELEQPLSLDINISNRCSNNCPYCYAGNTSEGKTANLLDMNYLDNITGMEIAINIQFPLPDNFELWLEKMKNQNIIVSGTINQLDFERDINILYYIKQLKILGLLNGIGISFRSYNKVLYDEIKTELGDDVVIHTIVGITPINNIITLLKDNYKVLILGYKQKNRGIDYFANINIENWKKDIDKLLNTKHNSVLAFDTAGLTQLNMKSKLSKDDWDKSFQGDEGSISFYIDAVNKTFNIDSHSNIPAIPIDNLSITEMFKAVKELSNGSKRTKSAY